MQTVNIRRPWCIVLPAHRLECCAGGGRELESDMSRAGRSPCFFDLFCGRQGANSSRICPAQVGVSAFSSNRIGAYHRPQLCPLIISGEFPGVDPPPDTYMTAALIAHRTPPVLTTTRPRGRLRMQGHPGAGVADWPPCAWLFLQRGLRDSADTDVTRGGIDISGLTCSRMLHAVATNKPTRPH